MRRLVWLFGLTATVLASPEAAAAPLEESRARDLLTRLLSSDEGGRGTARAGILRSGDPSLLPALVDALFFASAEARRDVVACLEGLSGERLGTNYRYWFEWIGGHEDIRPPSWYRKWKAALFSRIDPAFSRLLDPSLPLTIRAEEIIWGGVKKDGIPALKDPPTISGAQAEYLDPSETVFGITLRGVSRAYPQRILDWHEMVNDQLGGEPFALSYCTLCGAAIAYATSRADGPPHVFGSSGRAFWFGWYAFFSETGLYQGCNPGAIGEKGRVISMLCGPAGGRCALEPQGPTLPHVHATSTTTAVP